MSIKVIKLGGSKVRKMPIGEEMESVSSYPPEYGGAKPIQEQVALLAQLFSVSADATLAYIESELPKLCLPDGAEGYFAIVRWQKVGKTYDAAVELMFTKITASRSFHNSLRYNNGPRCLCQHERTKSMLVKIEEDQPGDILIVPAQFGLAHRGRSVDWARECFRANEFGFGTFQVGCMTLTHGERFVRWEQLHTYCPGDRCTYKPTPDACDHSVDVPGFHLYNGQVRFGTNTVGVAYDNHGSVSGFVPQ